MSILTSFEQAAQSPRSGAIASYALGLILLTAGVGGNLYSAFHEHGTGSPEGLERRGEFCHRDYQRCATDREVYKNCLFEKSILRQSARMNSIMLISLGLLIVGGTGVLNYSTRRLSIPKPE